nr:transcription factor bHLH167-like [Ipomoea batatas]
MKPEKSSSKPGRGLTEKHRRQQMKFLYDQLAAALTLASSEEKMPALDLLDQATDYIKELQKNIKELRTRKDNLGQPVAVDVSEHNMGALLEVNIVCGSENKCLKMCKVLRILEEEGAEVVSATTSAVLDKICLTILCKAFSSRLGIETKQVQERLRNLVSGR